MNKKHITVVLGILVVLIVAFVFAIYSFDLFSKNNPLKCSDYPIESRDLCCIQQNVNSTHITCVGDWKFDNSSNACKFVCISQEPRFCTQDVKECPDGSFVSRDAGNNCEFKPCP